MNERFSVQAALRAVARSDDRVYGIMLEHGTLELGFYQPAKVDRQQSHDRDEVYIIQNGTGYFVLRTKREPFESGDALFVPAGVEHRFEDFSDDFAAWVIFYGPMGGEP
ncbi:MAG: cupin domain-containing protein [Woeseia sp.]